MILRRIMRSGGIGGENKAEKQQIWKGTVVEVNGSFARFTGFGGGGCVDQTLRVWQPWGARFTGRLRWGVSGMICGDEAAQWRAAELGFGVTVIGVGCGMVPGQMSQKVPRYYLWQQRLMLGFASVVFLWFGIFGAAGLVWHAFQIDPGPSLGFKKAVQFTAYTVGFLAAGGFGLWVVIRWSKWVSKIAAFDRDFRRAQNTRWSLTEWVLGGLRRSVGDQPTRITPGRGKRGGKRGGKKRKAG